MANAMLERLDLYQAELSVLLTNDDFIRQLNRDHRHKDRPTDVLSFYVDRQFVLLNVDAPRVLGDIVISLDTAARQAVSRRRPLVAELRWLLAHGILHLLGYNHATALQKRRMDSWTSLLVRSAPLPEIKTPRVMLGRPRK
jgi:probable rRNA maturation factor